jgi:lysozyme-like protein
VTHRSPSQIYADLRVAGYSAAAAVVQTAIAEAESGGDDTARGDLGIQTGTWGPSFGLYQIRTLKADTGRGGDRDIAWLAQSDANQAKAAYDISQHGANFSPWTTYTRGTYTKFLPDARAAAGAAPRSSTTPTATPAQVGPDWAPWNWGSTLDAATANARSTALVGLFVVLGLALLGLGLTRALRDQSGGG